MVAGRSADRYNRPKQGDARDDRPCVRAMRALVTGAASGLGRAVAMGLTGRDVAVALLDIDELAVTAAALECGRGARPIVQDLTARGGAERAVAQAVTLLGGLDIVVNNAGYGVGEAFLAMTEASWDRTLDLNLKAVALICAAAGRVMRDQGRGGRIVNITSPASRMALPSYLAYAASKAGVASLTRSLAVEWSKKGVTVNAIAPGVFRTELNANLLDSTARGQELLMRTPMGRFGKTEELVGAAIYLASDAASYVTGQSLVVDGGFLASGVNQ